MSAPENERRRWLDEPQAPRLIFRGLLGLCVGLLVADLTYDKHVHYGFESWFGFYGVYGFVACVGLVLAAKELRKLVKRDEDYYD